MTNATVILAFLLAAITTTPIWSSSHNHQAKELDEDVASDMGWIFERSLIMDFSMTVPPATMAPSALPSLRPSTNRRPSTSPSAAPSMAADSQAPSVLPSAEPSFVPTSLPTSSTAQSLLVLQVFGTMALNVSIADVPTQPDGLDSFVDVLQSAISNSLEENPSETFIRSIGNILIEEQQDTRLLGQHSVTGPTNTTARRYLNDNNDLEGPTIDVDFRVESVRQCFRLTEVACENLAMASVQNLEAELASVVSNGALTNSIRQTATSIADDDVEILETAVVVNYEFSSSSANVREIGSTGGNDDIANDDDNNNNGNGGESSASILSFQTLMFGLMVVFASHLLI